MSNKTKALSSTNNLRDNRSKLKAPFILAHDNSAIYAYNGAKHTLKQLVNIFQLSTTDETLLIKGA